MQDQTRDVDRLTQNQELGHVPVIPPRVSHNRTPLERLKAHLELKHEVENAQPKKRGQVSKLSDLFKD